MAWTNDFLDIMTPQAQSGRGLQVGIMTGPNSCRIGKLDLKKEDLLFSEHLTKTVCTKVSETAPAGGGTCSDQSTYLPALKSGDNVLLYQMSDSQFVIIERLVSL